MDSCILYLGPLATGSPLPSGVPKIQNNFLELGVYVSRHKVWVHLFREAHYMKLLSTKPYQPISHNIYKRH
jgi:hypothetical protein